MCKSYNKFLSSSKQSPYHHLSQREFHARPFSSPENLSGILNTLHCYVCKFSSYVKKEPLPDKNNLYIPPKFLRVFHVQLPAHLKNYTSFSSCVQCICFPLCAANKFILLYVLVYQSFAPDPTH